MCPTLHNIARTKKTNVLTGQKSLVENREIRGRIILKRTIKTWEMNKILKESSRQCTYKRNNETSSRNHCCCGKAKVLNILSMHL